MILVFWLIRNESQISFWQSSFEKRSHRIQINAQFECTAVFKAEKRVCDESKDIEKEEEE